jgi:hypothetical protein
MEGERRRVEKLKHLLLGCVLAACSTLALAGRSCEEVPIRPETVSNALALATQVQTLLDERNAEVVLIGRAGQNLTRWGVYYSHFGFAWRDHPKGRWTVVHQLNRCGTDRSDIFDEGLGNFFLDDLWRMEAVVLLPDAERQERLVNTLRSGAHLDLHQPHYSMLAYPFNTRYQNSNQWALEVIAMAESRDVPVRSREQAQQWLKLAGYAPKEIHLPASTRLGARLTRANVAFDDHPGELRWSDRIRTVTVDSVFEFMRRRDAKAEVIPVQLKPVGQRDHPVIKTVPSQNSSTGPQ